MSDGMSEVLATFYGTGVEKTASAEPAEEDLVKQAQVELFCKIAAEQNIDIASMPDAQVEQLFTNFVTNAKTAAEESEPGADAKVDEAAKELEQKKEAAAEFAKYDFFGRQMAHAYVDELKKIAAAAGTKEAEFPPKKDDEKGEKDDKKPEEKKDEPEKKEAAGMPEALRKGLEAAKGAGKAVKETAGRGAAAVKEHVGKHPKSYGAAGGAAIGGAATALGHHMKTKKSSAIDELAMERAVVKAAEAGFDADEAAHRINAALVLDLIGESTKIASAPDVGSAVEVRALELLEAARYPVEWATPSAA